MVRFQEPPESKPLTAMFYFMGVMLTHKMVLAMIKGLLQPVKGAKVTRVQFVDRNVMLGKVFDNFLRAFMTFITS